MLIRSFIAATSVAIVAATGVFAQQGNNPNPPANPSPGVGTPPPTVAAVPAAARPEVLTLLNQGGALVVTNAGLAVVTAAGATILVASLGGSTVSTTSTN